MLFIAGMQASLSPGCKPRQKGALRARYGSDDPDLVAVSEAALAQ
jgi:hypothetical protein